MLKVSTHVKAKDMKAAVSKAKSGEKSHNENYVKASLNKALSAESEWEDKDEFLDVIYWMRQILGLLLGILWGLIPLKGLLGLILFFAINVGIVYIYYNSFQKIDDEVYGGPSEILKEGLMTSFSTFLVAWILLYSSIHTDL